MTVDLVIAVELDQGMNRYGTVDQAGRRHHRSALAKGKPHQDDTEQKRRADGARIEWIYDKFHDQTKDQQRDQFGKKGELHTRLELLAVETTIIALFVTKWL